MHASQRRFFAVVAGLAAVLATVHGLAGVTDLALYGAPALLIAALLLSGRFVGEERIVERIERLVAIRRLRPARARWPRTPVRALSSLLAHDARVERGPPALSLAA